MNRTTKAFNRYEFLSDLYQFKPKKYDRFWFIYLILELISRFWIYKHILEIIGQSEELSKFLDKNEFGLTKSKSSWFWKYKYLIKKDVLDESTFYGELDNKTIKSMIYKDYVEALLSVIKKSNIVYNIEKYLSIKVDVESNLNNRIYTVKILYTRDSIINFYIKKFVKICYPILFLFLGIILISIIIIKTFVI